VIGISRLLTFINQQTSTYNEKHARYIALISDCVFAQNVPCKFAVASGFEKNRLASKRFMSSLLHEMSSRVSAPLHTQGCQKVLK